MQASNPNIDPSIHTCALNRVNKDNRPLRELKALRSETAGLREDNAAMRTDTALLRDVIGCLGRENDCSPRPQIAASKPSTEGNHVDAGAIYDNMAVMGTRIILRQKPDSFLFDGSLRDSLTLDEAL